MSEQTVKEPENIKDMNKEVPSQLKETFVDKALQRVPRKLVRLGAGALAVMGLGATKVAEATPSIPTTSHEPGRPTKVAPERPDYNQGGDPRIHQKGGLMTDGNSGVSNKEQTQVVELHLEAVEVADFNGGKGPFFSAYDARDETGAYVLDYDDFASVKPLVEDSILKVTKFINESTDPELKAIQNVTVVLNGKIEKDENGDSFVTPTAPKPGKPTPIFITARNAGFLVQDGKVAKYDNWQLLGAMGVTEFPKDFYIFPQEDGTLIAANLKTGAIYARSGLVDGRVEWRVDSPEASNIRSVTVDQIGALYPEAQPTNIKVLNKTSNGVMAEIDGEQREVVRFKIEKERNAITVTYDSTETLEVNGPNGEKVQQPIWKCYTNIGSKVYYFYTWAPIVEVNGQKKVLTARADAQNTGYTATTEPIQNFALPQKGQSIMFSISDEVSYKAFIEDAKNYPTPADRVFFSEVYMKILKQSLPAVSKIKSSQPAIQNATFLTTQFLWIK